MLGKETYLQIKKNKIAYLLLAPALGIVVLVYLYPLIDAARLSFFKLYLLRSPTPKFVGFGNFRKLLADPIFRTTMINSIYWVVGSNICHFSIGLGLALLMNQVLKFRGLFRGIFLVPWVTPIAVVGILWKWIYNTQWGLLNLTLMDIGILSQPVEWLGNSKTMWSAIIFANAWKAYGFMYICFLAGLQNIPPQLHEAAKIDGASAWNRFIYVTLPLLRPVITVVIILGIAWTYNDFNMVWLLTQGGPGYASMVYGPFVYKNAFQYYRFGYASAAAVVGFSLMVIFAIFYLKKMELD